jgi:hypothetical protein
MQGDKLTTSNGSWSGSPTGYTYAWQDCDGSGANCTDISGATSSSYMLGSGDVGSTVRAVVTATNAGGSTAASSAQTGSVMPPPPANTTAPSISGTPADGNTLTASTGSWTNSPTSYTYTWDQCNASGTGCTPTTVSGNSYQVTSPDNGDTIEVTVTATNAGGSASSTSAPTAVVPGGTAPPPPPPAPANTALPTISGTAQQGQALTASNGSWSNSPTSYAYQWQDCSSSSSCSNISGATAASYTLASSDVGDTVDVIVTATNAGGSGSATSAQTQTVAVPPTSTFAGPTYLGNSFTTANNGVDSVPPGVMALSVSPDGHALVGAPWEEYNHDARLFDPSSGALLGPYTTTRNNGGIWAVAADSNYIYYASGDGHVFRSSLSQWETPSNVTWGDDGQETGVSPLLVDSGGYQLMGLAACDNELFVADPNGPLSDNGQVSPTTTVIKVIPTSLSGVTTSWSVPRARTIACDREGDIWVLQQGVSGGAGQDLERFTPTGTLLTEFSIPGYATGLAADPTQDRLLVPDNSSDQDFKWFNYTGTQTGQIGVTGGYLQGSDPGLIGPSRFVGPRAVAIAPSGDIITAESLNPGIGQLAWASGGPGAIYTEFTPSGSVVWRDYGVVFAGTGQPSSDGSRFYTRYFEFNRDANGQYKPYAYTVNPFASPNDPRSLDVNGYSNSIYERQLDGHVYMFENENPGYIYEQQPNSEIFKMVVEFNNNSDIVTNRTDVNVSSNSSLINNNGERDYWMDSSGNLWTTGGFQVWEYPIQGFAADGTPQYNFTSVKTFPFPPQLSQQATRIAVVGNNVYVGGYSSSDPNPDNDTDGWKSSGRHLVKYPSLPTSSGWPAPAWEYNFTYGSGTGSSNPDTTGFPTGFAVDGSVVGISWFYDPATNDGEILTINDSNGTLAHTYSPAVPGYGQVGHLDMEESITAGNGWLWAEDDWQDKIYGICPSGSCT